jgi:hypothetical protein
MVSLNNLRGIKGIKFTIKLFNEIQKKNQILYNN